MVQKLHLFNKKKFLRITESNKFTDMSGSVTSLTGT